MSLNPPEIVLIWDQLPTARDIRLRFEAIRDEDKEIEHDSEVGGRDLLDVEEGDMAAARRVASEVFDLWALMNCQPVDLDVVRERVQNLCTNPSFRDPEPSADRLFDISEADEQRHPEFNTNFYLDQKTDRMMRMEREENETDGDDNDSEEDAAPVQDIDQGLKKKLNSCRSRLSQLKGQLSTANGLVKQLQRRENAARRAKVRVEDAVTKLLMASEENHVKAELKRVLGWLEAMFGNSSLKKQRLEIDSSSGGGGKQRTIGEVLEDEEDWLCTPPPPLKRRESKRIALEADSRKANRQEENTNRRQASTKQKSLCGGCGLKLDTYLELEEHRSSCFFLKEEGAPSICPVCHLSVESGPLGDEHKKLHDSTMTLDDPADCPCCKATIPSLRDMNVHYLHEHDPDRLVCLQCRKVFTAAALPSHWKSTHRCQELLCPFCGKKFTLKYSYNRHIADHEGSGRRSAAVVCETCGVSFCDTQALHSHRAAHHGVEKTFRCGHCSQRFAVEARLKRHQLKHVNVKPFKCMLCDYTTNRRSNVPFHVKQKHKQNCTIADVIVLEAEMEKYTNIFPNTEARAKARMNSAV